MADEDDRPVGMIYARVSSEGQTEDDDSDSDDEEDGDEIDSGRLRAKLSN